MNAAVVGILVLALGLAAAPTDATAAAAAAPPPRVTSFSPLGTARQVRQVVARFSDHLVTLGDPRLEDPFTADCPASGAGRWADTRTWIYDFDADLDAGVRCQFTLKPGLKTVTGAALAGRAAFEFNTGGPAIAASLPREGWESVDEDQVFLLRLDAPATTASVEANAYCAVDGINERIPVKVLIGTERSEALALRRALGYDYLQLLWKNGEQSGVRARNRSLERRDEVITVLRCQRRLSPATRVLMVWGAGIESASGIPSTTVQRLAFRVRPAFVAQLECTRVNVSAGCLPMKAVELRFSAPVPRALALRVRLTGARGASFVATVAGPASAATVEGVRFEGPFPESAALRLDLPPDLTDDAGRALANAARFPLTVRIDAYPPLVKFSGDFGILEAKEGGVLPVTLRNVEPRLAARIHTLDAKLLRLDADPKAIIDWLQRVQKARAPSGQWRSQGASRVWMDTSGTRSVFAAADDTHALTVDKPHVQQDEEVVGIPLRKPGFYVLEIASPMLGAALNGNGQTRYVGTTALVTDLAVHFKWGRESSLAWVTELASGRSVADADVIVSDQCTARTLWSGRTDAQGVAMIQASLGESGGSGACPWRHPLMVLARKGADFSFSSTAWSQGISPYDFGFRPSSGSDSDIYHTVLDRALFQPGETVSMKHFLRQHRGSGLAYASGGPGMHRILIVHEGGDERYASTARFDAGGVATATWVVPAEAKFGDYAVLIDDHPSARFKIGEFRLPSMRGSVMGPARPLVAPQSVDLDLHVAYLSGGGAGGLPVKLRTLVEPSTPRFAGYEDFTFDGQPVTEGVTTNSGSVADFDAEEEPAAPATTRAQTTPLTLDASGSAHYTLARLAPLDGAARLTAELEYADANGEILTNRTHVWLLASAVAVGLRTEGWVAAPAQLRFRIVVLDLDGKPKVRQPVSATLYQVSQYSYRKRLIGGFYAYETTREVRKLRGGCTGVTDSHGLLSCELAPGVSGQVLVRAESSDERGNSSGATATAWIAGRDDWWFGGTSGDRMDVLPEKAEYQPGETARFQVRMPFRTATALVTVEREGVLEHRVVTLSGSAPVVEVPIQDAYAPNIYVSVLAVRGRVSRPDGDAPKPAISALVDLNKPAYRLGAAAVRVGWKPHQLNVTVTPAQKVFAVRSKVATRIHVATADGRPLPAGTEVAVAAVDEALLDLMPNASWDLLAAMMGQRGTEVWTSTAQMQVVGKRHYGRKAVPHGGGGGREEQGARELFDNLLFWNARLPVDANGDASVTVPLNDSLTSFRLVAVANGGAQLFGTGSETVATTQDLILQSGLPPLVREGDRYSATFTARNTTERPMNVRVRASGAAAGAGGLTAEVTIPAHGARDVTWPVTVPVNRATLDWEVTAAEQGGTASDRLKLSEKVIAATPVRTYQATITRLESTVSMPAAQPRGAVPGRGGLSVTLQPTLAGSLDGVRDFLSRYPYTCFEQQASRAVVLRSRGDWDALMRRLPAFMDGDGLVKYFASDWLPGDDTLTAYVLTIAQETGWSVPDAERTRMLDALNRFVSGRLVRRSALPTADLAVRKLQAIDALARYGSANAAMLDSLALDPTLLPTSALLDLADILARVPGIAQAPARRRDAEAQLRVRLTFHGTTLGFSTERTDALWWLMISGDSNANRLLLAALNQPEWREDIPRLVRGSLARQRAGHWNTTVANAWGALAMAKFSAAFESTPVTGQTAIEYGDRRQSITWPNDQFAPVIDLPWQAGPAALRLEHHGSGAPWTLVRAMAALPLERPLFSGFGIMRSLTAIEQQQPGTWSRGDVLRVHLDLEAQQDASWVAVEDPIPAGATLLGGGLGGQSSLLEQGSQRTGSAWLAFEERRFDSFRAYYRFVPKGKWSLEYTVRLNNPGTFLLPATRVEAMYAPEMLGELPNAAITVAPSRAGR